MNIPTFREISESREMLDREPHQFINLFIYFLLTVVIGVLLWACFSKMDVSVKAQAVVRPNSKISVITNAVSSKVKYVNFEHGKEVSTGDTLYAVEYDDLIKQQAMVKKQMEIAEFDLNVLQALKDLIINDTALPENLHNSELNSRKQHENEIIETKNQLRSITLFKDSVVKDVNLLLPSDNEYYTKYLDYYYNFELLKLEANEKEQDYSVALTLYGNGAISRIDYNNAQKAFSNSRLTLEKYKNENLNEAYTTINDKEEKLDELLASIEADSITAQKSLEIQRHDLIVTNNSVENAIVKAPINGMVNVLTEINAGDYLLENIQVLTIVPDGGSEFRCKIYISNKDITKIKVGDIIKYKFKALPYKEYGSIKGKVVKISSDISTLDQGSGQYIIEASIENKPIFNYKGEKAGLKAGMEGEALIVTDNKTVLRFLLEKIELIKS